ncbi:MAG: hypothetical protein Alpg2KO_17540 [Alphaproteobacteria bacterium]
MSIAPSDLYDLPALCTRRWSRWPHEAGKFLDPNRYMDELALTDDHDWSWVRRASGWAEFDDAFTFRHVLDLKDGPKDEHSAMAHVACWKGSPFGVLVSVGRDKYCDFVTRFITDGQVFMQAKRALSACAAEGEDVKIRPDWLGSVVEADAPQDGLARFYAHEIALTGQGAQIGRSVPQDGDPAYAHLIQANDIVEKTHYYWHRRATEQGANAAPGVREISNEVYRAEMAASTIEGVLEDAMWPKARMVDVFVGGWWVSILVGGPDGVFAFATPASLFHVEPLDPDFREKWRCGTLLKQISPVEADFDTVLEDLKSGTAPDHLLGPIPQAA